MVDLSKVQRAKILLEREYPQFEFTIFNECLIGCDTMEQMVTQDKRNDKWFKFGRACGRHGLDLWCRTRTSTSLDKMYDILIDYLEGTNYGGMI